MMSTASRTTNEAPPLGEQAGGADPSGQPLAGRLKAVVLLSGTTRATTLSEQLGRSVLDLPIEADKPLLQHWREQVARLAERFGMSRLPMRVLVNERAPRPMAAADDGRVPVHVEPDAGPYRGSGGAARDVTSEYAAEDWVLVASGGQLVLEPLDQLLATCDREAGDVQLIAHQDGTPTGMMLMRCGALSSISSVGFIDLKEQALPRVAQRHPVRVAYRETLTGLPIRTRAEYLRALFQYHGTGGAQRPSAFAETWQSTFSLIEEGAAVDESARVHDAVILRGATVGPGSLVVRSVVAHEGRVTRKTNCVERIFGGNGK